MFNKPAAVEPPDHPPINADKWVEKLLTKQPKQKQKQLVNKPAAIALKCHCQG